MIHRFDLLDNQDVRALAVLIGEISGVETVRFWAPINPQILEDAGAHAVVFGYVLKAPNGIYRQFNYTAPEAMYSSPENRVIVRDLIATRTADYLERGIEPQNATTQFGQ